MQATPIEAVASAPAPSIELTGFALVGAARNDIRRTAFTVSERTIEKEAALVVEARRGRAVVRARAASRDTVTGTASLRVLESSVAIEPAPQLTMRIGKAQLSWDTGLAFQPVGFFQRRLDVADLGDFEGRGEGLPLVAVTYGSDRLSATAVVSDRLSGDRGSERLPRRQLAGRVALDLDSLSASLIVRRPHGFSTGLGGTLSATLGERMTAHGSIYRDSDDLRAAIGGTLATNWQGTFTVEYAHDSTRYERRTVSLSVAPSDMERVVLAAENQLYGQLGLERGRLFLAAGVRLGLDDAGLLGTLSVTWRIARSAELRIVGLGLGGRRGSAYREAPLRSLASIVLRRAF